MGKIVTEFLTSSSLFTLLTKPVLLLNVLKDSLRTDNPVVVVSSVCPPYSTDSSGQPTYEGLNTGIEYNIRQHLFEVPRGVKLLRQKGFKVIHFFLMADTEVDLLPFLRKLDISEGEFVNRCQQSVEAIAAEVKLIYPEISYETYKIPPAARFLEYFGRESWYQDYELFRKRLMSEFEGNPSGDIARGLQRDAMFRSRIIQALLGPINFERGVEHIARQKAQYMAFAKLMRERFEGRLIVVNHKTPNFEYMNDKIVRIHSDLKQSNNGNFLPKIPLLQLNISTEPGEKDE